MAREILRKLSRTKVHIFKIKNRRGFAAICLNHLTEGSSSTQALARMAKCVKRMGFELK